LKNTKLAFSAMPETAMLTRLNGLHVLLIEDEESIRALVQSDLRSRGMQVTVLADGSELETLSEALLARIDAVITDVMMPKVDGPVVVEQLRGQRPDLPVVFMTGYADAVRLGELLSQPRTTLVDKPFHLEKIARALANVLMQ
jgi:two-component system cell cycle sensor histidine kinase/response regulator CckA